MDFFINKNSTLPILKMDLVQDGRNNLNEFYEKIQNSNIYFTMSELKTGKKIIGKKPALILPKNNTLNDEYFIGYKFNQKETINDGVYVGKFIIEFLDDYDTLIAPIKEELYIHILGGSIKK